MRRKRFAVCVVYGLAILCMLTLRKGTVHAGTVIDQEMTDIWGKRSGTVLFYAKKRLRIDQKDGILSTIIDFRKDRILVLDHGSRSYVDYPFSTWEKLISQTRRAQKHPKRRRIRVEPAGTERNINGFRTALIRVFADDVLTQETWVTQDVDMEDMLETIKESVDRLTSIPKTGEWEENQEIYRQIKKWGFPILTIEYRRYAGKTLKEITEVMGIQQKRLDRHLFDVPAGYIRRKPQAISRGTEK